MQAVHRFFIVFAILIATLVSITVPAGCTSVPVAFTKTATPVATSVIGDMRLYAEQIADQSEKSERLAQISAFEASVQTGAIGSATAGWSQLRDWLINRIRGDTSISETLRLVRLNDVEALDYIIDTANRSQAAAK